MYNPQVQFSPHVFTVDLDHFMCNLSGGYRIYFFGGGRPSGLSIIHNFQKKGKNPRSSNDYLFPENIKVFLQDTEQPLFIPGQAKRPYRRTRMYFEVIAGLRGHGIGTTEPLSPERFTRVFPLLAKLAFFVLLT